jgi:hypothetical protein
MIGIFSTKIRREERERKGRGGWRQPVEMIFFKNQGLSGFFGAEVSADQE